MTKYQFFQHISSPNLSKEEKQFENQKEEKSEDNQLTSQNINIKKTHSLSVSLVSESTNLKKSLTFPTNKNQKLLPSLSLSSSETWSCQLCTYSNSSRSWKCEICQTDRIKFPIKNQNKNIEVVEVVEDITTKIHQSNDTSPLYSSTSISTPISLKRNSSTTIEEKKLSKRKKSKTLTEEEINPKNGKSDKTIDESFLSQTIEEILPDNLFEDIVDQTFFNLKEPSHLYKPPVVIIIGRRVGDMKMGKNLLIGKNLLSLLLLSFIC